MLRVDKKGRKWLPGAAGRVYPGIYRGVCIRTVLCIGYVPEERNPSHAESIEDLFYTLGAVDTFIGILGILKTASCFLGVARVYGV